MQTQDPVEPACLPSCRTSAIIKATSNPCRKLILPGNTTCTDLNMCLETLRSNCMAKTRPAAIIPVIKSFRIFSVPRFTFEPRKDLRSDPFSLIEAFCSNISFRSVMRSGTRTDQIVTIKLSSSLEHHLHARSAAEQTETPRHYRKPLKLNRIDKLNQIRPSSQPSLRYSCLSLVLTSKSLACPPAPAPCHTLFHHRAGDPKSRH